MRKLKYAVMVLILISLNVVAEPIILDFSSGSFSENNRKYNKDGFVVEASHGFHSVNLGTLAWYETTNLITVSYGNELFSLESLDVVARAFAGLMFASSRGGSIRLGSGVGHFDFFGEDWTDIEYFTISTSLNTFDVLTQLDNIVVSPVSVSVSEPPTIAILVLALGLLANMRRKHLTKIQKDYRFIS